MSFQVLTGEVCQVTQVETSLVTLPSQVNLVPSNCAVAGVSSGVGGDGAAEGAERGAVLGRDRIDDIARRAGCRRRSCSAARSLGRPGMCLPMCARDEPAVEVVAAADAVADDQVDGLARDRSPRRSERGRGRTCRSCRPQRRRRTTQFASVDASLANLVRAFFRSS